MKFPSIFKGCEKVYLLKPLLKKKNLTYRYVAHLNSVMVHLSVVT